MTDRYDDDATIVDRRNYQFPGNKTEFSCLVLIYGEDVGRRYPIKQEPLLVGRAVECQVRLEDSFVSRTHCRIVPEKIGYLLEDLKSRNGTFVNDEEISRQALQDGDLIRVGRSLFKFLAGDNIEHAYHEEIYRIKTTDALTGAYNKQHFEEELQHEINRFLCFERPLCLLMLDLDHFKKVNDEHGHLAGDRVLARFGRLIAANIRDDDTLYRYGGEEFVIVMPEMDLRQAAELAERLCRLVANTVFEYEGTRLPVTVSIGVAETEPAMEKGEELVRVADARLYQAKSKGRNRVEPAFT